MSRRDANGVEACLAQERIEFSADHGVSAGPALQFHLTLNRLASRLAVGMKIGRAVIAFDHRNRAAGLQVAFQRPQHLDRPREVLQDEADENVVERLGLVRQVEDVGLLKTDVCDTRGRRFSLRLDKRRRGNIDRGNQSLRAVLRERNGLCPHAAAGFQDTAARRIRGIGVQQLNQRRGLVLQPQVFAMIVAVDVGAIHILSAFLNLLTCSGGH